MLQEPIMALGLLIRPLDFAQNDLCRASDKKTNFNVSKKKNYVKSGCQILYAVERCRSLFSR